MTKLSLFEFFYLINKAKSFFLSFYLFFHCLDPKKKENFICHNLRNVTLQSSVPADSFLMSSWSSDRRSSWRIEYQSWWLFMCFSATKRTSVTAKSDLSRPRVARFLGLTSRSRANRWDLEIRGASRRFRVSIRLWRYLGLPCLFICFSSFDSGLFLGCLWLVFGL